MTEYHKRKIKEGRERARKEKAEGTFVSKKKSKKLVDPSGKPICYITGKEEDAFSFFNPVKYAFRKANRYKDYQKVLREITKVDIWQSVEKIKLILDNYVVLVIE
jgi:hypothetical protein